MDRRTIVFRLSVAVIVIAVVAALGGIVYGIVTAESKIPWVAGLGLLGTVVYGSVRLYGHVSKGSKQ